MSDLDYRRLAGIIFYAIIHGMKYINNDICGVKKIEFFNRKNDLEATHIWSENNHELRWTYVRVYRVNFSSEYMSQLEVNLVNYIFQKYLKILDGFCLTYGRIHIIEQV